MTGSSRQLYAHEGSRTPCLSGLKTTANRMHPQIMDVSNRLFYDGCLRSGVSQQERTPPDGLPVVFIPVESERDGRSNREEAEVVLDLIRSFVRDLGIRPESIGVVSPFRAQVVLLRQMLGHIGVTVDTVERFQGGERDIMILSFVRSRGTGFVFDDRRLNVAITRARRKLVLVAHPKLFQLSRPLARPEVRSTPAGSSPGDKCGDLSRTGRAHHSRCESGFAGTASGADSGGDGAAHTAGGHRPPLQYSRPDPIRLRCHHGIKRRAGSFCRTPGSRRAATCGCPRGVRRRASPERNC
ncbi:MAG: hypothetical protein DMG13_03295 [Acidobacteria bacterium]|nr:MAG: hypothetical protein DMG13_03295 [Acidobacteriota bacterium]